MLHPLYCSYTYIILHITIILAVYTQSIENATIKNRTQHQHHQSQLQFIQKKEEKK